MNRWPAAGSRGEPYRHQITVSSGEPRATITGGEPRATITGAGPLHDLLKAGAATLCL